MIRWKTQKKLVLMCAYYIVMHRYADYKGMKQSPDARRLYALMRRIGANLDPEIRYYIHAEYWQPMRHMAEEVKATDEAYSLLKAQDDFYLF